MLYTLRERERERELPNWRAGASQPSRTTGTIFLYIYMYISILAVCPHLADPAYKLRYFICDTRGPTRNPGKITT